jgi:uncharacterized glyoxalase superfamily protein PhnB
MQSRNTRRRGPWPIARVFTALSEGGTVQTPLGETFFSPAFGMCTDRFGTPWMVMAGTFPSA